MDWELQLISLYVTVCEHYSSSLWVTCQRFTNGGCKSFSDPEVLTVYLFGILCGYRDKKSIHRYCDRHLRAYFPGLPKYAGFVYRVNRLSEAFRMLIENLQSQAVSETDQDVYLVDSYPIMLAKRQHAFTAKVAPEVASKSYNSTKKMYYYGVKAHVVARKRQGTLPDIEMVMIEEAARQDGPMFDQMRPMLHDNLVFADKAYKRPDEEEIEQSQNLKVLTPTIKERGQKELKPDQKAFSKRVSKIRQPIEALFAWLDKVTGIENAQLVRSTAGLMTHIFGKLAAAVMKKQMVFDF